jgi:cell division protein FtsI (penicillin-binding protein 3)
VKEGCAKGRFRTSLLFLSIALAGLAARLILLHLMSHVQAPAPDGEEKPRTGGSVEDTILARRGSVYDRNAGENLVALTLPVQDVCADPHVIVKSNQVAELSASLGRTLDVPAEGLASRLGQPDRRFAYVRRFVEYRKAEALERQNLTGVFFRDSTIRYYPQRSFLCHVLGFVNHEGFGGGGVEQRMDRYLRGCPGLIESEVDALNRELFLKRRRYVPPIDGLDIVLTIDQNIQFIVERELARVATEQRAQGAWAIVQRVQTGEILAMASWPCFDPNDFTRATDDQKLNRAIGCVYEPGSTLKAVTVSAALNEGTVKPGTVFDCERGAWLYKGKLLRDAHAHGNLTVADGVQKSSNILCAKVGLTLGDQRLHRYMAAFGLGSKLGIDLPGEETGILHPVRKWSGLTASRVSIGQGVAVTGVQMLTIMSTIANGGRVMRPYLVREVRTPEGGVLLRSRPLVLARPIRTETAATMRYLLSRVTEEGGTGTRARVQGYKVAGKTGTAQKPEGGGYSDTDFVASFVGFLPADAPEIALVVVVDEPRAAHYGGDVAAPPFARIAEQTVRYLDVPPEGGRMMKHLVAGR